MKITPPIKRELTDEQRAAYREKLAEKRKRVTAGIKLLRRNKDLMNLRREFESPCYWHKGISGFRSSWSSVFEDAVITREQRREAMERRQAEARQRLAELEAELARLEEQRIRRTTA